MRHGLKALGLSVLASLSLMALTTGGAQASGLVNSGEFSIEDGINESDVLVGGLKSFKELPIESESIGGSQVGLASLRILVLNQILKCEKLTVTNASILWLGHGSATITYNGCYVTDFSLKKAACTIANIETKVLALIFLHGAGLHPYVLFEPQSGKVFLTISPSGVFCTLPKAEVNGSVVAEVLTPLEHQVKPRFAVTEGTLQLFPEDKLFYGLRESHLQVETEVWLTGANEAKLWRAH